MMHIVVVLKYAKAQQASVHTLMLLQYEGYCGGISFQSFPTNHLKSYASLSFRAFKNKRANKMEAK